MMDCPELYRYQSTDTTAECMGYHQFLDDDRARALYSQLWSYVPTEMPPGIDNVTSPAEWLEWSRVPTTREIWHELTADHKRALVEAEAYDRAERELALEGLYYND